MTGIEKRVKEINPLLDYFRETGVARIVMCEIDGKYIPEFSPSEEPPEAWTKVLQDERTPVIHGWHIQSALDMAKLMYKYNDMNIKALTSPPMYEQLTSGEYDLTDIELEPSKWVFVSEYKTEIWLRGYAKNGIDLENKKGRNRQSATKGRSNSGQHGATGAERNG